MRIDEELVGFEATLLLRNATGWGCRRIKRVLDELGFSVPLSKIHDYLYENVVPKSTSPLIKSIFYNDAYKLALKLKEENPTWGYKKIRKKIREELGIWIPATTVYDWITGRSKPNITPLKVCPELGYVIGALMSDCTWSSKVKLRVKDEDFAKEFAHALKRVTGKEYDVKKEKDGYYVVKLHGSPLRYIIESGLWKIIAFLYPKEFLQGIFDGDGGVSVCIENRSRFGPRFRVQITLTNTNFELLEHVKQLLKRFEIECSKELCFKQGRRKVIRGKEYLTKRDCREVVIEKQEDVAKFYELIGFRIQRKQRKLKDAIEILRKYRSNKERVKAWTRLYTKVGNRWVFKSSSTFIFSSDVFLFSNNRKDKNYS